MNGVMPELPSNCDTFDGETARLGSSFRIVPMADDWPNMATGATEGATGGVLRVKLTSNCSLGSKVVSPKTGMLIGPEAVVLPAGNVTVPLGKTPWRG